VTLANATADESPPAPAAAVSAGGALRRALAGKRMRVGIVLTGLIVAVALLGPLLAPHDPGEIVDAPFSEPGAGLPLGTDYLGQDVLTRVLYGGRSVLWMALAAASLGMVFGVAVGLLAGYGSPRFSGFLMRAMDVLLAIPNLVLVLLFVSLLGSKQWLIVLLVALAWTPQVARVTQGITLEAAQRDWVRAAEVLGLPRSRVLLSEILPNLTTPLLVEFGLRLTWSIALIAGLSFLGFGIQPPAADWGLMINENRVGLSIQPWAVLAPIAAIALFTVGTNLMAEGLARTIAGVDRRSGGR
jgi:peptide/nickel transport system permease protein